MGKFNDVIEIFNTSDTNQIIGITNNFPTTPLPNCQPRQLQFPIQQQQQQLLRPTSLPATSSQNQPTSYGTISNGLTSNSQSINNNYNNNNQSIRPLNNNSSKSNNNIQLNSNLTINNVNNYTKSSTFPTLAPPPQSNSSSVNANISNMVMNNGVANNLAASSVGTHPAINNVNSNTFLRPENNKQPTLSNGRSYPNASTASMQLKHEVSMQFTFLLL